MAKKMAYYQVAKIKFVIDGLTIPEIALEMDELVSERTLYRWSAEHGWEAKRRAWLTADETDQEMMAKLKRKMLSKAMETGNPQDVYAYARLEAVNNQRLARQLKEIDESEKVAVNAGAGLSPETVDEIKRKVLGID